MALRLRIKNPDVNREQFTTLTASIAAAGTASTVASNDDFAANDYIVLGNPGENQAEIVLISSVSGNNTINHGACKFAHGPGTPIYKILYNQISVERQANGSGAYSEIAEGKVNIDIDSRDGFTIVSVAAGTSADNFKWRFYHANQGTYSSYSDVLAGTGASETSVAYMLAEFRAEARVPDHQAVTDEQVIRWFNAGQKRVAANHDRWWFLLTEDSDTTTANQYKFGLDTDFDRMEAVIFDDGELEYRLRYISLAEFDQYRIDNATAPSTDSPRVWTLLPPDGSNTKGYVGVHTPILSASLTLKKRYYKSMATLETFGDTTPIPLPEILVNFALWQFWKSRGQRDVAGEYYALYLQGIDLLKKMQRREVGQADFIKWRGHRGRSRLFGEIGPVYSDTLRENYW